MIMVMMMMVMVAPFWPEVHLFDLSVEIDWSIESRSTVTSPRGAGIAIEVAARYLSTETAYGIDAVTRVRKA